MPCRASRPARPGRPARIPGTECQPAAKAGTNAAPTERTRPTWGELAFKKEPIPLDESLQKVSRNPAVKGTRGGADRGTESGREDHGLQHIWGGRTGDWQESHLRVQSRGTAARGLPGFPIPRARWSHSTTSMPT